MSANAPKGKRNAKQKRRSAKFYVVGEYYLTRLKGDERWYIAYYDREAKQRRLEKSGAVGDEGDSEAFERAKKAIHEFAAKKHLTKPLNLADPATVPLAQILLRRWKTHGQHIRSSFEQDFATRLWMASFPNASVADVVPVKVDSFIEKLAENVEPRPEETDANRKAPPRKPRDFGTVNKILSVARAALNVAQEKGLITHAPRIRYVTPDEPLFKDRPVFQRHRCSVDEVAALFDLIHEPHLRMFCMVACSTLARPENVMGLRLDQIDWEGNCIRLNPAGRHQTKKYRGIVPIPNILKPWLRTAAAHNKTYVVEYKGRPIKTVANTFRRLRTKLGLPMGFTSKSLRHTVSTELRRRRVNPWELSVMLGHERPEALKKQSGDYAVLTPEMMGYGPESVAVIDRYMRAVQAKAKGTIILKRPLVIPPKPDKSRQRKLAEDLIPVRVPTGNGGTRVLSRAEIEARIISELGVSRDAAQSASTKAVRRLDPDNPDRWIRPRLSESTKRRIAELSASGMSTQQVANLVGVDKKTAWRYRNHT